MTLSEAAGYLDQTEDELWSWINNFKRSGYRFFNNGYDCDGCIYTDADGGALLIKGYSEIYETEGGQIELLEDCTYCNIEYSMLKKIFKELESSAKEFEKNLMEEA
jgi:hypothetical protein